MDIAPFKIKANNGVRWTNALQANIDLLSHNHEFSLTGRLNWADRLTERRWELVPLAELFRRDAGGRLKMETLYIKPLPLLLHQDGSVFGHFKRGTAVFPEQRRAAHGFSRGRCTGLQSDYGAEGSSSGWFVSIVFFYSVLNDDKKRGG